MNDTQFDDFFNDKLKDHAAPVPAGLWAKVVEGQLDQFIGNKLKDAEAPVPNDLWGKIADTQFDNFIGDKLYPTEAAVPAGLWDKITDGRFDNFVAGKLIDHEAPVPEGLWEKVRPKEEDDRPGFIWFRYPAAAALVLFVLLVAGSIGGYLYFSSQKKTGNGINITNSFNTSSPNNKNAAIPGTSGKTNDQKINDGSVVPPVANELKTNQPAADQKVNQIVPGGNLQSSPTDANATTNSHLKNDIADRVPSDKQRSLSTYHLPSSSANSKKGFSLKPPVNSANNNGVTENSYDIFRNNSSVTGKATDQSDDRSMANDNSVIDSYQHNQLTPGTTVPTDLNKNMLSMFDKQLSTLNHTSQFRNVIVCPSDHRKNTDWLLEAYLSPDIPFKSATNVSATQQYMARKDSSESSQVSFSAGLRLVKPITDNIILKAGIQYSQVNQKYVYRTENEVKTTTVVTERTIIRGPGDTVLVKDTSTLQTIGFRNNTVINHYKTFDIPVTIGYQFGDEDLKFGINAGVAINLTSWYQGVILDSALGTVPLNKTGNGIYKTNIGLGLIGSVSVIKRLSDDMHIFVEPYFRYNLSDMTTSQSTYRQKFSLGGLSVGLRINLNRK